MERVNYLVSTFFDRPALVIVRILVIKKLLISIMSWTKVQQGVFEVVLFSNGICFCASHPFIASWGNAFWQCKCYCDLIGKFPRLWNDYSTDCAMVQALQPSCANRAQFHKVCNHREMFTRNRLPVNIPLKFTLLPLTTLLIFLRSKEICQTEFSA